MAAWRSGWNETATKYAGEPAKGRGEANGTHYLVGSV